MKPYTDTSAISNTIPIYCYIRTASLNNMYLICNGSSKNASNFVSVARFQTYNMHHALYLFFLSGDVAFIVLHTITARVSKDPLMGVQFALNYNRKV
jgi:hypothetical protein